MKRIFLLGATLVVLSSVTACKKNYTCSCELSDGNGTVVTTVEDTQKMNKKDAEEWCVGTQEDGLTLTCALSK